MFRSRTARFALMSLLALATLAAGAQTLRERLAQRRASQDPAALAAALPAGSRVLADLAYGEDPAQRLDVYAPPGSRDAPVILMVHGGGWRNGDKAGRGVVGNKAARWLPRGMILVSTNYRMLPAAPVTTQADDVARALAYVQSHARDWGGDPERVVLMGHSAGAHLVALLSAAPSRAYRLGARPWLGTVSLDSAALDVPAVMQRRHMPLYDAAFGADPAQWRALSPLQQLDAQARPLFAVCSSQRKDRPCDQAHAYAEREQALGLANGVREQALSHGQINSQLGVPGDYTAAVEAFLARLDPQLAARLHAP